MLPSGRGARVLVPVRAKRGQGRAAFPIANQEEPGEEARDLGSSPLCGSEKQHGVSPERSGSFSGQGGRLFSSQRSGALKKKKSEAVPEM